MAESTIDTYLLDGGVATGVQTFTTALVAINDTSDLEGEVDQLQTTTLSDSSHTFIDGVQGNDPWVFECNYSKASYEALKELAGIEKYYGVFMGDLSGSNPTGADGMWVAKGKLSVKVLAMAVNEVRKMSVKIIKTTAVTPYYLPTLVDVTVSSPVVELAAASLTLNYIGVPTAPTLAYQWYDSATETGEYSAIPGATNATYTPGDADAGDWIKCTVTASGTATGTITSEPEEITAN